MQAIATVEAVTQDTADVLVPGVYMQDLNERIRLTPRGLLASAKPTPTEYPYQYGFAREAF